MKPLEESALIAVFFPLRPHTRDRENGQNEASHHVPDREKDAGQHGKDNRPNACRRPPLHRTESRRASA